MIQMKNYQEVFFYGWIDDVNKTLTIPGDFTDGNPGCWKVRLIINNPIGCVQSDTAEETIIVEPKPAPSFTYPLPENLCTPVTLNFTNTSNTESVQPPACGNPMYTWSVVPNLTTPATADGFTLIDADTDDDIPAENQTDININFNQPGTYTVTLELENICGVETFSQEITVIGDPTVVFNPDALEVCQVFPADYTLDFSDTEIAPTYSESPFTPEDYLWEVFESDGVTPATNYSFLDANGETLEFPQINFTAYGTYIIRVSVSGDCGGGATDDFTFILKREPVITNTVLTQTLCSEDSTNLIDFTSDISGTTYKWEATTSDPITGFPEGEQETASIPSLSLVNSCNVTGVVTVAVTPFLEDCAGETVYFEFIVNPKPSINNIDLSFCSDEQFLIEIENDCTVGNIIPEDTAYTWQVASISGEASGVAVNDNGTGYVSGTVTNTSASDVLIIYEVIPTSNQGCLGDPFIVTVTVNPEPVVNNQSTVVCSDVTLGYTIIGDIDNPEVASYNLTSIESNGLVGDSANQPTANGLSSDALTADVWTNTTSSNVNVIYTLVPVGDNGCEGDPFTVTVTVNPEPVVADQSTSVCSDETLGFLLANDPNGPDVASYNLTDITFNGLTPASGNTATQNGLLVDAISNDSWNNITGTALDVVYTFVPVGDNGCLGDPFTVTVTVNPEPVVADQTTTVCSDEALGYILANDIDTPNVASYNLTNIVDNGLIPASGNTAILDGLNNSAISNDSWNNITSAALDVVYTFVPVGDNGCLGNEFTVTVTVNPEPVVDNQTITVCSDENLNQAFNTSTSVAVDTYNVISLETNGLTVSAGNPAVENGLLANDLEDDAFTNTTNAPVDVIYTVVPVSGSNCEGDPFTVIVTVNPEPVVADQSTSVCSDETLGFLLANDPNGPDVASYNLTDITFNGLTPASGNTATQNGLLVDAISNDSWNNITGTALDVVYTFVPVGDNGCLGDPFTVTITVNPEPVVADQTTTVCSDEALGYILANDIDTPNVASYNLTNIVDNGLIPASGNTAILDGLNNSAISDDSWNNITSAALDVVYTFVPVGDNGCLGNEFTVTVTVNPEPVVDNQTITVCSDENLNQAFNTSTSAAVDTYNVISLETNGLTVSAGNPAVENGLLANDLEDDAFTNTTNAPVDVIYTVVPVSGSNCEGDPFTVIVTVNPEPVVADQSTSVCSDETLGFLLANDPNGPDVASYNLTDITFNGLTPASGNTATQNGLLVDAISNDSWNNITGTALDVVYTFVPVGDNGCLGDPFTVTATIDTEPVGVDSNETVCSDGSFNFDPQDNITTNGNAVASTFTWEITQITGTVSGVNQGDTGSQNVIGTITNTNANTAIVEYTITPTSENGCVGTPFKITLTITPEPVVDNQTITVCSDENLNQAFNTSTSAAVDTYNVISLETNGLTVSAGNPAVENGLLANDLEDDAFTNTTNAPVDVIYTVVPVSGSNCEGDPFTVIVTVNPEPVVADQSTSVCSDETLGFLLANDPNGPDVASYNLTDITFNGLTPASGNTATQNGLLVDAISNDSWNNITGTALDVVYTFVPVGDNGCLGDPFTVTATIDTEPVGVDSNETVISDVSFNFDPQDNVTTNGNAVASTFTWEITQITGTVSGVNQGDTGSQNVIGTITNTNANTAIVEYTITPTSENGCVGTPFKITLTITPEPVVDNQTITVCSDENLNQAFNTSTSAAVDTYNVISLETNGLTVSAGNPAVANGFTGKRSRRRCFYKHNKRTC